MHCLVRCSLAIRTEMPAEVFYSLSIVILFESSLEKVAWLLFILIQVLECSHLLLSRTISRSSKTQSENFCCTHR